MVDLQIPPEQLKAHASPKDETSSVLMWLLGKALSGFAFAIFFVGGLLAFNIANLKTLILASDVGGSALFVLTFFLGLTFASIQMGIAIMHRFGKKDDDDDHSGKGPKLPNISRFLIDLIAPAPQPKPIRVRAKRLY